MYAYTDKVAQARKLREQGMTLQAVAVEIGASDSWVHKWCPKQGRPWKRWNEKDLDTMRKMRLDGKTTAQIAKVLHRTPNQVRIKLCRLRKRRAAREAGPASKMLHWMRRAVELGCPPDKAFTAVHKADII